jgi:hypothetical protein
MDLGSESSKHSFWKINPVISGHLHAVWFCVVTWSVILAQTGDLGSPARVMLQFWCFAAVAQHGTPPNRQLNTLFNMPGVYVRSLRMPHLGLPTCQTQTTQKKRPTVQVYGLPPSRLTTHRGKMHLALSISFAVGMPRNWLVATSACVSRNTRCVYLWPWRTKPCLWESLGPVCSTAHGKAWVPRFVCDLSNACIVSLAIFWKKKKALRPCKIPKLSHVAHIHVNICKSCNMMDRDLRTKHQHTK